MKWEPDMSLMDWIQNYYYNHFVRDFDLYQELLISASRNIACDQVQYRLGVGAWSGGENVMAVVLSVARPGEWNINLECLHPLT